MLILWIYIALVLSILAYIALAFIRYNNVSNNRIYIINAIFAYHVQCHHTGTEIEVSYEDMEDLNATTRRIWDWGYTRILPQEKFEIIKPYINEYMPSCYGLPITTNAIAENACWECPFEYGCIAKRKENINEN